MTAQDPQAMTGDTSGYAGHPVCVCGHLWTAHEPKSGIRHSCRSGGPVGPCGCRTYQPAEVTE